VLLLVSELYIALNNLHSSALKRIVASIAGSSTVLLYATLILMIAKN